MSLALLAFGSLSPGELADALASEEECAELKSKLEEMWAAVDAKVPFPPSSKPAGSRCSQTVAGVCGGSPEGRSSSACESPALPSTTCAVCCRCVLPVAAGAAAGATGGGGPGAGAAVGICRRRPGEADRHRINQALGQRRRRGRG